MVLLSGPRQVGKSTLAQRAAETPLGAPITLAGRSPSPSAHSHYLTLDDATTFAAAAQDPQGWLQNFRSQDWTVIDEVQRLPELLVAIKRDVDLDRRPNRYLLTGSANIMTIPHVAESLAGRVELLQMWPLSQTEIEGSNAAFLETTFSDRPLEWRSTAGRSDIVGRALRGGYPEAMKREDRARRNAWFGSYVTTVVQREVRSVSNIVDDGAILRVLRALASRSGQPRNTQSLSRDSGIPATTISRHIELLKATFLVTEIPPWSGGVDARIVRSPKMLINDSGLYGYLLNLAENDNHIGFLIENFVGAELIKLASYLGVGEYMVLHFRTRGQREVDFVVEASDRRIVGYEVKTTSTADARDFQGLKALAEIAGKRFHRGIVLYNGNECVPFGPKMWAVPISAMWQ
ncbi:MAG TPA: ATP-binding protein [Candidatus Baltobacteraceae bacterium]